MEKKEGDIWNIFPFLCIQNLSFPRAPYKHVPPHPRPDNDILSVFVLLNLGTESAEIMLCGWLDPLFQRLNNNADKVPFPLQKRVL